MKKKARFAGLNVTTSTPARTAGAAPARSARPPGRSADPTHYKQITAYVGIDAYKAAKLRLVQEDRQLSEVVGKLLDAWLSNNVSV